MTTDIDPRIEFVVYVDEPVANWPPELRALKRCGVCALSDLDTQQFEPDEIVFVVEQHGDPRLHAVSLTPYTHLVDRPEMT